MIKRLIEYFKNLSFLANLNHLLLLILIVLAIPLTALAVKHQFDIRSRAESPPNTPVLVQPVNNSTDVQVNPRFLWRVSDGSTGYRIYLTPSSADSWYWYREGTTNNTAWSNGSGWRRYAPSVPESPPNQKEEANYYNFRAVAINSKAEKIEEYWANAPRAKDQTEVSFKVLLPILELGTVDVRDESGKRLIEIQYTDLAKKAK